MPAEIRAPRVLVLGLQASLAVRRLEVQGGAIHAFQALGLRLPESGTPCRVVLSYGAVARAPWARHAPFFGYLLALPIKLVGEDQEHGKTLLLSTEVQTHEACMSTLAPSCFGLEVRRANASSPDETWRRRRCR